MVCQLNHGKIYVSGILKSLSNASSIKSTEDFQSWTGVDLPLLEESFTAWLMFCKGTYQLNLLGVKNGDLIKYFRPRHHLASQVWIRMLSKTVLTFSSLETIKAFLAQFLFRRKSNDEVLYLQSLWKNL